MTWSNSWSTEPRPNTNGTWNTMPNPWDAKSQDELLTMHLALKQSLEKAKADEMDLRKYIVNRAFPQKHEGVNTLDLGNGYSLKAGVKFNYKLADNDTVEKTLDKIAAIGNEGQFIAERLVGWTPTFHLQEYRTLMEAAPSSAMAQEILATIGEMLTISDAAPTLEIKEPRVKK